MSDTTRNGECSVPIDGPDANTSSGDKVTCANCGRRLAWHAVRQVFIHADLGHWWCSPERQGYAQPTATPASSGSSAGGES